MPMGRMLAVEPWNLALCICKVPARLGERAQAVIDPLRNSPITLCRPDAEKVGTLLV